MNRYILQLQDQTRILMLLYAAACFLPHSVLADPLQPIRTFSVQTAVAARETIAAAAVSDNKVYLLITDRAPTGRSAIFLAMDSHGNSLESLDLNAPAYGLVEAGGFIAAVSPLRDGLRLLRPSPDGVRATDLSGLTANVIGTASRLIRVLGTGDLAVHDLSGDRINSPRIVATSAELRVQEACTTCGLEKRVAQGAYIACPLPGDRLALVHRSSARFRLVDLNASAIMMSTVLDNEDIQRGRAMFARQQESARAIHANPSNPSIIVAGATHASGDIFLLIGPFTPAEGARVIRVRPSGGVVASVRCAYPAFDPSDGPPQFLGISGNDLYLASFRGRFNVYSLSSE